MCSSRLNGLTIIKRKLIKFGIFWVGSPTAGRVRAARAKLENYRFFSKSLVFVKKPFILGISGTEILKITIKNYKTLVKNTIFEKNSQKNHFKNERFHTFEFIKILVFNPWMVFIPNMDISSDISVSKLLGKYTKSPIKNSSMKCWNY